MINRPKILLIGAGRFGKNHLRVLKKLDRQKKIELVGVITKSNRHKLTNQLLKSIDAVDIVTPGQTHFSLAKKCINHCHVFIEKPLAENFEQAEVLNKLARKNKKVLIVGHIYRFHPTVLKLKEIIKKTKLEKCKVSGQFISPQKTHRGQRPASEMLHLFDMVDFIWDKEPIVVWSKIKNNLQTVDLRYSNNLDAHFLLGWEGDKKERFFSIDTPTKRYDSDLSEGRLTIVDKTNGKSAVIKSKLKPDPLEKEIEAFIDKITGKKVDIPDGRVGARVVKIAELATKEASQKKDLKIAIIGGGIFGLTSALKLSKVGSVTVFERHSGLLAEASKANQYRHHMGYHYPRSLETISEIKNSTDDFEDFYRGAIVRSRPAYYAISKEGSYTTPEQFLKVCKQMKLPYKKEYPTKEFLNRETVDLCIKTPEAIIDYQYLNKDIKKRLAKNKKIILSLRARVKEIKLLDNSQKQIIFEKNGRIHKQNFDIVINATYANYNNFCEWLNFSDRDLEFRLKELPIIKLEKNLPPTAIMVMDGPFATLVPLGRTNLYTFGDAPLSIHAVGQGQKALKRFEAKLNHTKTRWPEMRGRCLKWFPFLEKAEYLESMFVILPVEKSNIIDDARPTEVTNHGFGCYSILSGKIITAVTTAKEIISDL